VTIQDIARNTKIQQISSEIMMQTSSRSDDGLCQKKSSFPDRICLVALNHQMDGILNYLAATFYFVSLEKI